MRMCVWADAGVRANILAVRVCSGNNYWPTKLYIHIRVAARPAMVIARVFTISQLYIVYCVFSACLRILSIRDGSSLSGLVHYCSMYTM